MLFIVLATLSTSLTISINEKEFTGDTFDQILTNYGSDKSTIQSIIVNNGLFSLSSITTAFSQLSTLHIPRESFVGEVPTTFLKNLKSLTDVQIGGATVIKNAAFQFCSSLRTVSFPLCEKINEYAFAHCTSLQEISFKSCTEIGNFVFKDCTALSSIDFPVLNILGYQSFLNTALTSVKLDSVTMVSTYTLGSRQFSGCTKLKYISMKSATVLTSFMFEGCAQLSSYDFPLVNEIKYSAFVKCQSITTLNFPSLITIDQYAFSKLNGIQEINLPYVGTIGEKAFQYCSNLKSVSFQSCTRIDQYAFQYCSSLSSVDIPKLEVLQSYAFSDTSITKVQFDSVSTLNIYVFSGCSKLAQVSMRSAPIITKYMFEKCYQLRIVDIPSCTSIEQNGFKGCSNIQVLTLGYQTVNFNGIPSPYYLQKVNFPYALSIESNAFSGLSNLVFCNLPNVNTINSDTFKGLSKLVELEIPAVTELKENAFIGCISLSSISLKSLSIVDSTSTNIFNGCQYLKTLYLPSTPPKTFHKDTFKGMNCKIVIPLDAVSMYDNDVSITDDKANDGFWCGIPLPSDTLTIKINNKKDTVSGQQLSDCIKISGISESLITSLEIVSGMIKLTTIIDSINKLPVLEDFIISESVIITDVLTEGIFKDSSFSSITIDTSIEKIPKNCFINCANIKKVKFTNCKEIEDSAFKGCINLNSVIINAETLSGDSHFEGCQSLTSVSLTHLKNVDPASSKIFLNCPINSLYFPSTPPSTFHPKTFNGRHILFFGLSSTELNNYDSNTEVEGDVANDHKWCGIDLFQIYIEVSINGQSSVSSDSILNAINLAGISYVSTIDIIGGYVTSSILNEIKGISSLKNFKISETAVLESYIIGPEQFKNHGNLEYIEIMHNVSLSDNCFMGCTSLIHAEFGSANLLSEGCFKDCKSLTSLVIPQCQKLKGDYIFANCEKLKMLDLSSLLYIDSESENIFSGCINLEKIMLPSVEPTTFNKNSFKDCQNLLLVLPYSNDYIKYDDNSNVEDDAIGDNLWCGISFDPDKTNQKTLYFKINDVEYKRRSFKNLPIKNPLTTLKTLEENVELKSLELIEGYFEPDDLKAITSGSTTLERFINHEKALTSIFEITFNGCTSLKEIVILSETEIEHNAFQNLPALTTLTLSMIKVVNSDEFKGDINLQNVSLPLVSSIPKSLFASLENLYSVDLLSASTLYDSCFYGCANLEKIYLPSVTRIIGDSHFSGCKKLKLVYLPSLETVNPEGSLIFENCNSLDNLTLPNQPPLVFHKDIFNNAGKTPSIHLLDESGWKNYYKQCTIDPETDEYHWYGFNLDIKRETQGEEKGISSTKKGYSTGTLVGAIIGSVIGSVVICIIIMLVVRSCKHSPKGQIENEP